MAAPVNQMRSVADSAVAMQAVYLRCVRGAAAILSPGETFHPGAWLAYLVGAATISAVVLMMGAYPVTVHPEDTVHVLAQADYLHRGLRPYVDYHSMHGPAPFLFFAGGVALKGISLEAVVIGQMLGGLVLGLLVFLAARNRFHGLLAVAMALSAQLILVSFTAIGEKSWREFSCAMWYNAVGFILSAIVFIHLLTPPRDAGRGWRCLESLVVGLTLGFAFCTKVTFFVPLLTVYVLGEQVLPRRRGDRLYSLGSLVAGTVFVFVLMAVLGGSITGYLRLLDAMSIKVNPMLLLLRYLHFTKTVGFACFLIFIAFLLSLESRSLRLTMREFVLAILMVGSAMLAASMASQDLETLPMLGAVPLGLGIAVAAAAKKQGRSMHGGMALCLLIGSILLQGHAPKNSVLSWVFSRMRVPTIRTAVTHSRVGSLPGLAPNVDPGLFEQVPAEWSEHQKQAVTLIGRHRRSDREPLFVASITTAVPSYTGQALARGQAPWWPMVFSASPVDVPLLDKDLLHDAQWILEDREDRRCWEYLLFHRAEYIGNAFEPVAESTGWRLYGRRSQQPRQ